MPAPEGALDPVMDPDRRAVLQAAGLLDTPAEQTFDRYTRLARELLEVEVSLLSLVDHDRQFFKSQDGLAEPWAEARETPLTHSFCQQVVRTGAPLVVADAREDARVAGNQAIRDLGVIGYAGVPLTVAGGHTLGAFCVVTTAPHVWTEAELRVLDLLGQAVAEEIELRRAAAHHALHDPVTGLPTRGPLTVLLERALDRERAAGVAVVAVELGDHPLVVEALGHAAADAVLREVAARLSSVLRDGDIACRLTGAQFLLLCDGLAGEADARRLAARLLAVVRGTPLIIRGERLRVAASVGVALPGPGADTADALIAEAFRAIRDAPGAPGGPAVGLRGRAASSLRLQTALAGAVERGELSLAYQPIVDLRTGAVAGAEALARWNHPQLGAVAPTDFIPVAERAGRIGELGEWALRTACAQLAEWRATTAPALTVSVNLSPLQLRIANLPDVVAGILEQAGVPPAALTLEITESVLLEDEPLPRRTLAGLADLGVAIALDDFGTGYSCLSYLHTFSLESMKIDRSFVDAMEHDVRRHRLVQSIIAMAGALELRVTAEGIETDEQLAALIAGGCDRGQGYRLGRPGPAAGLGALLAAGPLPLAADPPLIRRP